MAMLSQHPPAVRVRIQGDASRVPTDPEVSKGEPARQLRLVRGGGPVQANDHAAAGRPAGTLDVDEERRAVRAADYRRDLEPTVEPDVLAAARYQVATVGLRDDVPVRPARDNPIDACAVGGLRL